MGITFTNNATNIPNWTPLHHDQPRSYAYESNGYAVSVYGGGSRLYTLSPGLTVSQRTDLALLPWVGEVFGATDVQQVKHLPGQAIRGVWRPGLYRIGETDEALGTTAAERLSAEQALHLLIERLYELFLYVEPTTAQGLASFGHKSRELPILAATEVENGWRRHARDAGMIVAPGTILNTAHYVRLKHPLHLHEYEVSLRPYQNVVPLRPFATWSAQSPTQSLPWYDAYNKTKHDREAHFHEASLQHCIEAVAGAVVIFVVRFGPHSLIEGHSIVSSHFNQLFDVRLVNPDPTTFYLPLMDTTDRGESLVCGRGKTRPWTTLALVLP